MAIFAEYHYKNRNIFSRRSNSSLGCSFVMMINGTVKSSGVAHDRRVCIFKNGDCDLVGLLKLLHDINEHCIFSLNSAAAQIVVRSNLKISSIFINCYCSYLGWGHDK